MKRLRSSLLGFVCGLGLLCACTPPLAVQISKARNRNFAFMLSNITTSLDKDTLDELTHLLAEDTTQVYSSRVYPMNFSFNELIDFKAIYLCALKDIDTVILLDGQIYDPLEEDLYLFKGAVHLLNPSTFKEMLVMPVILGPRDYQGLDIDRSREDWRFGAFRQVLGRKVVTAEKMILSDPNNYPRMELVKLADLLFDRKQYHYAKELYERYRDRNPDYKYDSLLAVKVDGNIDTARRELESAGDEQAFSLRLDLTNAKEKFHAVFKEVIAESDLEEALKAATNSSTTLSIDYDDVFNRCYVRMALNFDREFYDQNRAKFNTPEVINRRKVITLAPYLSIIRELAWLRVHLSRRLSVLKASTSADFDLELVLLNFRQRVTIPVPPEISKLKPYGTRLVYLSHEKREFPVDSQDLELTSKNGIFVLGNLYDAEGLLSGSGLLFQFFQE